MALGFVSYSADADNSFKDALTKARAKSKDLRGAFSEIARQFYKFRSSIWQQSGPGQYPDLSPKYKKQKKRSWGFIYPILKASGALQNAMAIDGEGNITEIGEQSAFLGVEESVVPYARFHQNGSSIHPVRKFLFFGEGNEVKVYKNILKVWVIKQAKSSRAFNG